MMTPKSDDTIQFIAKRRVICVVCGIGVVKKRNFTKTIVPPKTPHETAMELREEIIAWSPSQTCMSCAEVS